MSIIDLLNWRYATKHMNGQPVPEEKLNNILEAIRLSASSMGLQPYTILNIQNPEIREKLKAAANNQPQITQSSNLLVFAAWKDVTEEKVEQYISDVAVTRGMKVSELDAFKNGILGYTKKSEDLTTWTSKQAYIALGTALIAAAEQQVDATPMEGFNPDMVDEILGLDKKGLRSVILLPLGYRDEEKDYLSKAKKVRRNRKDLILDVA